MYQTAIIIFRETLEIALILGVLFAATRGLPGRGKWIGLGMLGGVLGSGLVAVFAGAISNAVDGMGQEVFNAIVLLLAAGMIGWTVVWMRTHGKMLTQHLTAVGKKVSAGELPHYTLATVILLAMLREGAEMVMFTYGLLASGTSFLSVATGAAAGLAGGSAIGLALYFGLAKIPVKHIFSVTSWLLVLLAAGMSAQAAGFLASAGFLPEYGAQLWDSSWLLSEKSAAGQVLHALVGYTAQPSGIQVMAYGLTVAVITLLMQRAAKPAPLKAIPAKA